MLLKATYPRAAALLQDYLDDLPQGGLFVPTTRALVEGQDVVVSVRFGRRSSPVLLRGLVAWRRTGKHSTKTRAGVGVSFVETERTKRDYILACARGEGPLESGRKHQRLPVDLPVQWQVPGTRGEQIGVMRDIGKGGAFVSTAVPLRHAHGVDVVLLVAPPGAEVATPVSARVAWVKPQADHVGAGTTISAHGFGVAWKVRDTGGGRRIRELVRRMEALAQGQPQEPSADQLTSSP